MSRTQESTADHSRRLGQAATVLGVLSLLGFAWLLSITATSLAAPEWARITGVWLLPIGVFGALMTGVLSIRSGDSRSAGRPWAITGLALAGLAVAGTALLVTLWPQ